MNYASFLDLVHNLTLLLATAFVFDLATTGRAHEKTLSRQMLIGAALGIMGIIAMLVPWTAAPGIIFDSRSILLCISGLFFGWLPAAAAMAMTGLFRLYQGGAGAWTGTAVILASGCIGIAWRHAYRRPLSDISWKELYGFGLVVHLVMLGLMLTLPRETALWVLSEIALPVIVLYPLGTLFLGMLMAKRLQKEQLQKDLQHSQEHLEELVKQRTLRLEEKNSRLIREIKKRRQAEKATRESEERYRILVDLTPGIIYRIRENGTIDFISHAVQQLGYTPEDLMNTPFINIVHPDDKERCSHLLMERRTGKRRTQNLDVRLLHKTSHVKDYALNFSFVRVSARGYWDVPDHEITRPDKNFLYTLGIAHDISLRKKAENALKKNEKKLNLLKDVAAAANAAATPEDALKVAVAGIARYLGWPVGHVYMTDEKKPDTLVSTGIWSLADGDRFQQFKTVTEKTVFPSGHGLAGRVYAKKKTVWLKDMSTFQDSGRQKNADESGLRGGFGFPVTVGGKVAAVLEFFSSEIEQPDRTLMKVMDEIGVHLGIVIERKQIEKELEKLARAVEASPATVIITDVQGRIQYANPKFTDLTGYSLAEAKGKTANILNSGFHPKTFYQELWQTILSGSTWYGIFCNQGKKGNLYWERASISPIRDEHGKISHFVAVKEDITRLRQYEDELRQAKEDAERANRAKSDFLANMSHELRTPLNAIIGFSEVLKEQYFGPLVRKQEEYVQDILDSGKHLLLLINDILDLAKVEAGKTELELSRVAVSGLIANSINMIKEKMIKHQITLDAEISPDAAKLEIFADERKLKQVLYNLLSNAAKFTPDGGAIRVTAGLVQHFRTGNEKEKILVDFLDISVEDTGIGISPAHQEKIFTPFFQVDDTEQGKHPGTGLGLPLSRDLVALHGGTLSVESAGRNKGSRFFFRIPVNRESTENKI